MRQALVLIALVGACVAQDVAQGNVTVLGDLTVTGSLRASALRSQALTVDGSISVTHGVSGESLVSSVADVTVLETTSISSPTGVVQVSGDVSSGDLSSNSSLSVASFIQNDVRQWAVVHHDDFEEHAQGWNTDKRNLCGEGSDLHLGGHCNELNEELKKTFSGLGEHTHLRLNARFHFLDSWEGETAYAKIGDKIVWLDTHDTRNANGVPSACGGEAADKLSVPIDVTVRHSGDAVTVAFGASLDEHPCNESFGIDDVVISVR